MSKTARRELAADVRHGLAVVVARLDAVHPAMFAPTVLLLVLILAAAAVAAVVLAVAAVAVSAALGFALCARRVLAAAAGFEGRSKPKEVQS
jgi:hypothetical protein